MIGTDSADTLHERNYLDVIACLRQMLDAAKVEADMQLGIADGLAFADHLQLVRFFQPRMVGPHRHFVAHFATSCRLTPGRSSLAQQKRLVLAAGEINGILFVNFALDPVGGFADIVRCWAWFCRAGKREIPAIGHWQVPKVLETKSLAAGQFIGGDGDESCLLLPQELHQLAKVEYYPL